MKCISKRTTKLLSLCIVLSIFLCGCGSNNVQLKNMYSVYETDLSNTSSGTSSCDFLSKDLCVTEDINFGTDKTDSQVATSAGVFNDTTKEVIYSQNLFERIHPASTTKILTAYIIIRDCNLEDIVTIPEEISSLAEDSSVCGLQVGDQITVKDLLYGLLLASGNDAAISLAVYHSGSVEKFAQEMTSTAHALGATNSNFVNPHGLDDENHYTTAYDMYIIFQKATCDEQFNAIISSKEYEANYKDASQQAVQKKWTNSNRYLTEKTEAPNGITVCGGKTGTTYESGYCLVLLSYNEKNEKIISLVFKADGSWNLYLLMNQILSFAN